MTNSKTFRLFISSTFSDFKREREVLQGKVFPHIKAYAAQLGYTFQPIDLRWGVSNEAQLDQKTLELCLDEVKACKTFKHPNFLVMLGDRYGWVPLPYAIETPEFETLCALMPEQEKQGLTNWYVKDINQLPASYILQERSGEFEAFEHWEKEEIKLRGILQSAAEAAIEDSKINSEQRKKYFTSATEAEVEEGIISYLKPTLSQTELMEETQTTPEIDAQHVFGFFRSIEPSSKIADTFIADDADQRDAKNFSCEVSEVLRPENCLHREVKQIAKNKLDETYLQDFQKRVTQFLESKIDAQKEHEDKFELTHLDIELEEQQYFAQRKRKHFIGQEKPLALIDDYIENDNQQPLVIYGKSGSGKSALMAKAIQQAQSAMKKKVIYRFVGATADSSSTRSVLTSICDELELEYSSKRGTLEDDTKSPFSEVINGEAFEQYCQRINTALLNIDKEVVIFIDAVDQLNHRDQFLWLPKELPEDVKIVISALQDVNYVEDSQYLQILKTKTDNMFELAEFTEPEKLIKVLLKAQNRTLQSGQLSYVLQRYNLESLPLYIRIAVQEFKHWKSHCYIQGEQPQANIEGISLQGGLRDITQGFIDNLSSIYHHNKKFVNKVIGYIYASKSGLSESELLQLISVDSEHVESIAPETWHSNITKEVPLVHWSRLQAQLAPFLSVNNHDNEQLICFSHRGYSDVIAMLEGQKEEHEAIIAATQILIKKYINQYFFMNRWGKLYLILVVEYQSAYNDDLKLQEYTNFISENYNPDKDDESQWVHEFVQYAEKSTIIDARNNNLNRGLICAELYHLITRKLTTVTSSIEIVLAFVSSLQNKALINSQLRNFELSNQNYDELVEIYELLLAQKRVGELWKIIENGHINALNNFAVSLKQQNQTEKKQLITDKIHLYEQKAQAFLNASKIEGNYNLESHVVTLNNRAITEYDDGNTDLAINNCLKALTLVDAENEPDKYRPDYNWKIERKLNIYTNLVNFYREVDLEKSIAFGCEAYQFSARRYEVDREVGLRGYIDATINLVGVYQHDMQQQLQYLLEIYSIVEKKYESNNVQWAEDYTKVSMNLSILLATTSRKRELIPEYLISILKVSEQHNLTQTEQYRYATRQLILFQHIEKLDITMQIFGVNVDSTEADMKNMFDGVMACYKESFATIRITDIETVSELIEFSDNFNRLFIIWLVSVANLAIICKENSVVQAAHEFSDIFIRCIGAVCSNDNIKAVENTINDIYEQTRYHEKSSFIDLNASYIF